MAGITINTGETATFEWVGTTLVISTDSGAISCDLKGKQGDMGVRGVQGIPGVGVQGVQGEKPVKGVDYWTEEDKTEIVNEVLEGLPTAEGGVY